MSDLHVETYTKPENSQWLVFLHGFGGSTKMWNRQIEPFRGHYNLCVIDLPGHGQSSAGIRGKHIKRAKG